MQKYTIEQLSDAATYAADAELATLARRVAEASTLDIPTGERKRLALSGGMSEAVHTAVLARCAAEEAAAKARTANLAFAEQLPLPTGWSSRVVGETVQLTGPYNETMHASLKRHGMWMADARRWDVPLEKVATVARSIKRQTAAAAAAAPERAKAARRVEAEKWLRYVESKAATGYLYEKGVAECQKNGIHEHAELNARLTAAIELTNRVDAEQRAARERERAAEREKRDAERAARGPLLRHLYPLSNAPRIGTPVKGLRGKTVVYTGSGQSFRVNADHPSTHGEHLLEHEGELGAYFYYREATATEVELLKAEMAAEAEAARAAAAQRAEAKAVAADVRAHGERLADNVGEPAGEIVNDTRELGVGTVLIVTNDAVYCVDGYNDNWDFIGVTGVNYWRSTDPEVRRRALELKI